MSESQRFGLYYPYLHFPDNWLKVAALYWPRMGRIVPPALSLGDSDIVRTLSDDLNFIENVAPGSAAEELTFTLTQILEAHYAELRNRYSVSSHPFVMSNWCRPSWPQPQQMADDWRIRNQRELRAAATVVALHAGKGEDRLWQMLSDAGLAVRSGDWWGLHPELAWLYMCVLTDKLARRNLLIPTTDQYIAHIESFGWTDELFGNAVVGKNPQATALNQGGRREQVGLLALNFVIPSDLENVPISKIVRLRQRYFADFDAFYDQVTNLAHSLDNELTEIADEDVLVAYIANEVERRFRRPLAELQGAMRGMGVGTLVTALTTKFELPTSAAILGGALSRNPVIVAGAALAFGAGALVRSYQQTRHQVSPSAASYLWRVDQAVNSDTLLRRITDYTY